MIQTNGILSNSDLSECSFIHSKLNLYSNMFFVRRIGYVLLLSVVSCAQVAEREKTAATVAADPLSELRAAVMELDSDTTMRFGQLAVSVKSVRTGQPVLEQNVRRSMVIASNVSATETIFACSGISSPFKP